MAHLQFSVLTQSEIEQLHRQTLDVYENPGVKIGSPALLKKLARAGARVDEPNGLVRFPREMVEELRSAAPPVARMSSLGGRVLEVGGANRYYSSLILDPYVIDYERGPRRPVLEDVRRHTIIGESLDLVSAMMRMQFPIADMPEPRCYLKTMEVFLRHCSKHVPVYPTDAENARQWIGAGEILSGGKGLKNEPLMSLAMAVTSPLTIHHANAEILEMALDYNLPLISTVCPMAGSTAPYTVAGTMLLANAEALLPVLVAQAVKPGHPSLYGIGPSVMDLRHGHDLYYKAEKTLFKLMAAQMGKFYGLPVSGEAGGTMTWRYDPQNGAEGMLYLMAAVAGGQNLCGGLGSCHNANGMSAEQIVLQCGMVEQAEYLARGVSLTPHELGLDSIRAAGPGGNFLTDDLTVEYLRGRQFFTTPYFDYAGGYRESAGAVAMAHEMAESLVNRYQPTVPENVQEDLRRYFEEQTARLA